VYKADKRWSEIIQLRKNEEILALNKIYKQEDWKR